MELVLNQFLKHLFTLQREDEEALDLEHLTPVLKELGDPHRQFSSIHVAGTNGKGSVVTKIAVGLQASGKTVGLFTSPHLLRFHERIRINGEEISDDQVLQLGKQVLQAAKLSPLPLHFFEITTLMAFLYFANSKVDVAVLETGLGGLLDATNVVNPLLSVITSISRDHVDRLGNTLDEIAMQKAGIIKPGVPVVLGPCAQKVPCLQKAAECGAFLYLVKGSFLLYEEENRAIARRALQLLGLEQEAIQKGLEITPPCRFQERGDVIFDVAHNPDGFLKLFAMFHHRYPNHKARLVLGLARDKEIRSILEIVAAHARFVHLVQASHKRAAPVDLLLSLIPHSKEPFLVGGGLERALCGKQDDEKVIVCGSFYVIAEALASLKI